MSEVDEAINGPSVPTRESVLEWATTIDPMGDGLLSNDPHPYYKQMREHCPIVRNELHGGFWMLTKYEDVFKVMRDAENYSNAQLTVPDMNEPAGPRIPLQLDGAEHQKTKIACFGNGNQYSSSQLADLYEGQPAGGHERVHERCRG